MYRLIDSLCRSATAAALAVAAIIVIANPANAEGYGGFQAYLVDMQPNEIRTQRMKSLARCPAMPKTSMSSGATSMTANPGAISAGRTCAAGLLAVTCRMSRVAIRSWYRDLTIVSGEIPVPSSAGSAVLMTT